MAFLGTLQKRTWMDDILSGAQIGTPLAQMLTDKEERERQRKKQIADAILTALSNTTEEYIQRMKSDPGWPNSLRIINEVYPGVVVNGDIPTPRKTMEQLKAQTYQTLTPERQERIVTGETPAPFEPKKESYAFAFKQVQDAIAAGRQPNPTWLKVIEAYIAPVAGKELTGKDKVVQETWELVKEDLYGGRQPEPWQWEIVGGYIAPEKVERLDPFEQAYKDVYTKYTTQGAGSLDEIERNILKYHPTEPGPKDAIIKQIWAKYEEQGEDSLTDIERAIIAGIMPKEEGRIPAKEAVFEQVWRKYLDGETLTDVDRAQLGAELGKQTALTPQQQHYLDAWKKSQEGVALTDADKSVLRIYKAPTEPGVKEEAFAYVWQRYLNGETLTDIDRSIIGAEFEKKTTPLTPKEDAFKIAWDKSQRGESLNSAEEAVLGITPEGELKPQEQVVEWAFSRVKKAIAAGQDPEPGDLQVIGRYVKGGPEETITAKIKTWAFDEMLAGRGTPRIWKILGGDVEPAAPVKSELKTINGDLWMINAVTGEKRRIIKGEPDKQKVISEAFDEALAYAKGKWPGFWERALDPTEQKKWDLDFRTQWHKNLITRGFTAAESRLIIKPSPLATGQETMYAPPETPTLTPDQRRIYNAVLNKAKGNRETIRNMQQNLANWGLYTGSIDGVIGPDTREALYNAVQKGLVKERGR